MQSKFNFKPKNKNKKNSTYLHDLSCTLYINLKEILNIKNNDLLSKEQTIIIRNKISKISELFKNFRKIQKNKKNIKNQILLNNQLIQEIKRRKQEGLLMLQEKKIELMKAINKKALIIKKYKTKFNEIEIYIRRECQYYSQYKNLYMHFCIDSFININTTYLHLIKNKKQKNNDVVDSINLLKSENMEYKRSNSYSYNKSNDIVYKFSNINILEDKNKYFSNEIETITNLYKNLLKDKFVIKYEQIHNRDKSSNKILNNFNLNQLLFEDNNSKHFKSKKISANSLEVDDPPDSSELSSY